LIGVVFSLFLLAVAGIPRTGGFVGKFAVFKAAVEGGAVPLIIVGVIASAIVAFVYARVNLLTFFAAPPDDAPAVVVRSSLAGAAIVVGAAVTVGWGAAAAAAGPRRQRGRVR
jgi:NADH-quinone oxidoreductase subunit N